MVELSDATPVVTGKIVASLEVSVVLQVCVRVVAVRVSVLETGFALPSVESVRLAAATETEIVPGLACCALGTTSKV